MMTNFFIPEFHFRLHFVCSKIFCSFKDKFLFICETISSFKIQKTMFKLVLCLTVHYYALLISIVIMMSNSRLMQDCSLNCRQDKC